ncbi:MAG: hypothetical protein AAB588_02550 [Patescibacteria group bacterium]
MDMSFNPNRPKFPLRPSAPEERHRHGEHKVHRHMLRALDLRSNASRRVLLEKRYDVRDRLAFFLERFPEDEMNDPRRYADNYRLRATLAEYRRQLRWLEENIGKMPRQPEDLEYE